ncbi:MAG: GUN4 domain-containing protein, partial [Leptolyngbyaceae bacterium]|nr:GUN4 domain-containing protein [Leptolyngbyaceae bacterium]
NDLHIKAHDVRAIEQKLHSHWQAEQAEAERPESSDDWSEATEKPVSDLEFGMAIDEVFDSPNQPNLEQPEDGHAEHAEHAEHMDDEPPSYPSTLPPTQLEQSSDDPHPVPHTMPGTVLDERGHTPMEMAPSTDPKPTVDWRNNRDETSPLIGDGGFPKMVSITPSSQSQSEPRSPYGDLSHHPTELASDRNIDYRTLQKLLREHQWREADNETYSIMVRLSKFDQPEVDWPCVDAIRNLPATDLHTMDRLWYTYSEGNFGFREQYRMYDLTSTYSKHELYSAFGKAVKWMLFEKEFTGFKYYNQLIFDHHKAPKGHLPAKWFWEISPWESLRCGGLGTGRGGCGHDNHLLANFMSHLKECGFLVATHPSE